MALVVDASVGLKWVLEEPDSDLAEALVRIEPDLLVPDFWLNEAINVLWLQVRRKLFTPDEAREGLALLQAQIEPTPTAHMRLHEVALDIGIAINHSTYDTLYLAFAVAMGANAVVTADVVEIASDLARSDIESGNELDVADMITTKVEMHDSRDRRAAGRAAVKLDALDKRGSAIPDTDDCDPDPRHLILLGWSTMVSRRTIADAQGSTVRARNPGFGAIFATDSLSLP